METAMQDIISDQEFNAYSHNSSYKILAANGDKPKVIESETGEIIRFFYPKKKLFSSNKYRPYAVRFSSNAKQLNSMNIAAPTIKSLQYYPPLKTHILRYEKLLGEDARSLLTNSNPNMIANVITFIAKLHEQGVFFRSIHMGNVIIQPNGGFGLIDIADTRFNNKPLSLLQRYRNLKHIIYNLDDAALWNQFGVGRFLETYFASAKCRGFSKILLTKLIEHRN